MAEQRRPGSAPTVNGRAKHVATSAVNRNAAQKRIDKENESMYKRLAALKKQPPSKFHSEAPVPNMKSRSQPKRAQTAGGAAGHTRRPSPSVSDPTQFALVQANTKLQQSLTQLYKSTSHQGREVAPPWDALDVEPRWRHRTNIYDANTPALTQDTGVPRCMAVALCHGCGRKSFFGADGRKLTACGGCKKVFYCSKTCREVDAAYHKQHCNAELRRSKAAQEKKSPMDHWVANAGWCEGRKLLQHKTKLWPHGGATKSIVRRMKVINAEELKEEMRVSAMVKGDGEGLDGPRPCCMQRIRASPPSVKAR